MVRGERGRAGMERESEKQRRSQEDNEWPQRERIVLTLC